MKVLILIPTKETVEPAVMQAIMAQDHKEFSVQVSKKDPDPKLSHFQNIIANRKEMRDRALKTDAEWFLWIDSDVVIPQNAISEFLKADKPLMGGWYFSGNHWSVAVMRKDAFTYAVNPEKEIIKADHIGFGFLMMKREVLEKIDIRDCTGEKHKEYGVDAPQQKCECFVFCEEAKKEGYEAYALPLIAKHNRQHYFLKMPVQVFQTAIAMIQRSNLPYDEVEKFKANFAQLNLTVE